MPVGTENRFARVFWVRCGPRFVARGGSDARANRKSIRGARYPRESEGAPRRYWRYPMNRKWC